MRDFDQDVWMMVIEVAESERHFNEVQHHYRILASTWLLAMFAGIGFVLSAEVLTYQRELIICAMGLFGAIGISQLWNLDVRIYHQLLDGCFVQGLSFEKQYSWLPQLRTNMMKSQGLEVTNEKKEINRPNSKGILTRLVWFYLVAINSGLIIFITAALIFISSTTWSSKNVMIIACVSSVLLVATWTTYLLRNTTSPSLEKWMGQIE